MYMYNICIYIYIYIYTYIYIYRHTRLRSFFCAPLRLCRSRSSLDGELGVRVS